MRNAGKSDAEFGYGVQSVPASIVALSRFPNPYPVSGIGSKSRIPHPSHISRLFLLQVANPDVPDPHRMLVLPQPERQPVRARLVRRPAHVRGRADRLDVVLNQNTIVENGEASRLQELAGGAEPRTLKHDVVTLPFAGLPARLHEWRGAAGEGRGRVLGGGVGAG